MNEETRSVWSFEKAPSPAEIPSTPVDHIESAMTLAQIKTGEVITTLRAWGAALKDGGTISIRVPDFDRISKAYEQGESDTELSLLGDSNRSIWNREKLSRVLNLSGYEVCGGVDRIGWSSIENTLAVVAKKCSRPVPSIPMNGVQAIMSLPRLAWSDTQGELHQAAAQLGINTTRSTGVFWGQCLERLIDKCLDKPECKYILTVDYDSVFSAEDIIRLWQVMETNPTIAALCPLQIGRDRNTVLVSAIDADGNMVKELRPEAFYTDALDINTGHFGLTLIRCDAIRDIPRPLFFGQPNKDGRWEEGRVDDDIHFWYSLQKAKRRICVCPKVRIGHIQTIVTWPGQDMQTIHQYCTKYHDDGRPEECMTF